MCKFCDCRLDHEKKDSLDKHVKSSKHGLLKAAYLKSKEPKKRQTTLEESSINSKKAKEEKQEFILDTLDAFTYVKTAVEH